MPHAAAGADDPHQAHHEIEASISSATLGLQGLMDMLAGCPPAHPVRAGAVHALLAPVADQMEQAGMAWRLVAQQGRQRPDD